MWIWCKQCNAGLLRSDSEVLAVGPQLDLMHVFLEIRSKNSKIRRRFADVEVISEVRDQGRLGKI
jgi:hypothetical protein